MKEERESEVATPTIDRAAKQKGDEKPSDEGAAFWAGIVIALLVAGLLYFFVRATDEKLYRRAYSDAMKAATTCTEAMERVHEVCGSDKPSDAAAPPVFAPIPIPN